MTFHRGRVPTFEDYCAARSITLHGRGAWRTAPCGIHGGSDSLRVNTQTNGWTCMACGAKGGDALAFHQALHGLDFVSAARDLGAWEDEAQQAGRRQTPPRKPPPPPRPPPRPPAQPMHPRLSEQGLAQWRDCKRLDGIAVDYLHARRCRIPPADSHLRWHPHLRHPSGYTGPALVGLITDASTREPLSLHRTWVQADGRKAEVQPPRLLLAGHRKQGGVIRLCPDEAVTTGLGVAEGIESALSLAWAFVPVWACIDAGNLAALPVLAGIEHLIIAADNDPAGQAAAQTCATRWAAAGRTISVTVQRQNDLNDLCMEVAA